MFTSKFVLANFAKRLSFLSVAAVCGALLLAAAPAPAQDRMKGEAREKTVTVGGAPMLPSRNIIENIVNSRDHTVLVAAVKAAGLVDTLAGKGPLTMFAPTNTAFGKLPSGALENLMKPENKAALAKILAYHVVAEKLAAADLTDGRKLRTLEGEELTVKRDGSRVWLLDARGGKASLAIPDAVQSNGVIHVIDAVLMPAT